MIRTPPMRRQLRQQAARLRQGDRRSWSGRSELPAGATGALMTYMHRGKQFIVVPIGSTNHPAEFVAFSLP